MNSSEKVCPIKRSSQFDVELYLKIFISIEIYAAKVVVLIHIKFYSAILQLHPPILSDYYKTTPALQGQDHKEQRTMTSLWLLTLRHANIYFMAVFLTLKCRMLTVSNATP